jgi:hypothetical protein
MQQIADLKREKDEEYRERPGERGREPKTFDQRSEDHVEGEQGESGNQMQEDGLAYRVLVVRCLLRCPAAQNAGLWVEFRGAHLFLLPGLSGGYRI